MNATFTIDPRLYQRGQLWTECIEEWTHQRHYFLEKVRQSHLLENSLRLLQTLPPQRLLVIYGLNSLDSLFCLPHLGPTLARAEHITTRYFCLDYYFPAFIDHFGRSSPKLVTLAPNGQPNAIWGPRPAEVTQLMRQAGQSENRNMDRWLLKYVNGHYPIELDHSIKDCLEQQIPQ